MLKKPYLEDKWEELREEKTCEDPLVKITHTKLSLSSKINFYSYFKKDEKLSMLKIHLEKKFFIFLITLTTHELSLETMEVQTDTFHVLCCASTSGEETFSNKMLWPYYGQHIPRLVCRGWINSACCELMHFQESWYQKYQFWKKEQNYLEVRAFFGKSDFPI